MLCVRLCPSSLGMGNENIMNKMPETLGALYGERRRRHVEMFILKSAFEFHGSLLT